MKTLVLCNQKGGVGKSAVATLLAHHLAHRGQRVLAIDLDHRGNFTKPLRLSGRAAPASFAADALMTGAAPALPAGPSRRAQPARVRRWMRPMIGLSIGLTRSAPWSPSSARWTLWCNCDTLGP